MFVLLGNAHSANRVLAILVTTALLLMSLGFTKSAQADNVREFSDLITDSAPSVVANHTLDFIIPNGVTTTESITITFPTSPDSFDLGTIGEDEIDLLLDGVNETLGGGAGQWTIATTATTIVITSNDGGATLPVNATTTIRIGTNAVSGATGVGQIVNPATSNTSYEISVTAGTPGDLDIGATRVAIVDTVTVTATVDTQFDFSIFGVATGSAANGTTTTGTSYPTLINFGDLNAWEPEVMAQRLSVETNARNGYVVTVEADGQLTSETGADIDSFEDGTDDDTPKAWQPPANTILQENTYGHWGMTSTDGNLQGNGTNFLADQYITVSSSPRAIMAHNGPADGTTASGTATLGDGIGSTTVAYQVEISPLQEAADDYSAILTYIATPTF